VTANGHPDWNLTPAAARTLQNTLRERLELRDRLVRLEHIAGIDVGFPKGGRVARAAIAVFTWPALEPLTHAVAREPVHFPYIPGLLAFRELPAVLAAWQQLTMEPDLLLCDGQGIAHPRRFGVACHLGLLLDKPALGVGKTRLLVQHDQPQRERGSRTALLDHGEQIGCVVRTRTGVRPVYVSPGHRLELASAVDIVLRAAPRYRLPEPIRAADHLASRGLMPAR